MSRNTRLVPSSLCRSLKCASSPHRVVLLVLACFYLLSAFCSLQPELGLVHDDLHGSR